MLRRAITLLILLLMTQMAVSQEIDDNEGDDDPIVDSLLREYARANSDTARLRLCYEIANQSNDIEIVTKYSKKGIKRSLLLIVPSFNNSERVLSLFSSTLIDSISS